MKLENASYSIFDVETTGLYPYSGDKICEIGAVRMTDGKRTVKKFHALIDPERPISPGASAVNGITDDMVTGKPTIDQVLPDFLLFIKGSVLVAYNAGFDLGFIESALGDRKEILEEYRVIDALRLARRLFPGVPRYNLGSVARSLGISADGEHRAMADAVMTWKVFMAELKALKSMGVVTLDEAAWVSSRKRAPVKAVKDYKLALIEAAIREQKKLNIIYRSSWNNQVTERTITPKSIHRGYDRLYIVAQCHMKNAERNFRFDCIIKAENCLQ
jgi:DNA polymerase III epsilon subunit family exonuclease